MLESNKEFKQVSDSTEAPEHLQGMQLLAEGYQGYISYLKEVGDEEANAIFGELTIEGF